MPACLPACLQILRLPCSDQSDWKESLAQKMIIVSLMHGAHEQHLEQADGRGDLCQIPSLFNEKQFSNRQINSEYLRFFFKCCFQCGLSGTKKG